MRWGPRKSPRGVGLAVLASAEHRSRLGWLVLQERVRSVVLLTKWAVLGMAAWGGFYPILAPFQITSSVVTNNISPGVGGSDARS